MVIMSAERHPNIVYFRRACMAAIDRNHPAFADLRWNIPEDELIAELARRSRAAVVPTAVPGIQEDGRPPDGNRYTLAGETARDVIDRCLAGRWCSSGQVYELPGTIDYTISPDPSLNTANCIYGEWTWQLSRHWEWRLGARLFVGTGEERYADAVLFWIERWLEQAPPPPFDINAQQPTWRTIEIGVRLAAAWTEVLSVLAERFDDETWLAWLGAWALQAPFVWQHRKHNNWLHMEMNGLLHAGVALPFMRDAALWRDLALGEMRRTFDTQVYPDGMQYELSSSYHHVCIQNLERPLARLREVGYDAPPELQDGIAHMYQPFRALARPDGHCWAFQDSGMPSTSLLAYLPERYRKPGDQWLIDGSSEPPSELHSVLPYAGYAVLRSGWHPEALCLAFDGGPFGASHQHEDKLGFQLCAHGTELIGEAGTVGYADSPQRRYCLQTVAHSCALVDGEGQKRRLVADMAHIPLDKPADLRHDLNAEQPWVESSFKDGFGDALISVRHTRRITLLADDAIEVRDHFVAEDGGEHDLEILFHLLVAEAEPVDGGVATRGERSNCALHSVAEDGSLVAGELAIGGEGPDLRGWGKIPLRRGPLEPLPCWTLRHRLRGETEVVTHIAVFAPGRRAEVVRRD